VFVGGKNKAQQSSLTLSWKARWASFLILYCQFRKKHHSLPDYVLCCCR